MDAHDAQLLDRAVEAHANRLIKEHNGDRNLIEEAIHNLGNQADTEYRQTLMSAVLWLTRPIHRTVDINRRKLIIARTDQGGLDDGDAYKSYFTQKS
jgi:hypothetical protein